MIEFSLLEKSRILLAEKEIQNLYEKCFDKTLDSVLWRWAFLNNPVGAPVIALAKEKGTTVGHYAMTPILFKHYSKEIIAYLSMTTMVHPNFRKEGLFAILANMVYEAAPHRTFVYGFPKSNSTPGFVKRLEWQVDRDYVIAQIEEKETDWIISNPYYN